MHKLSIQIYQSKLQEKNTLLCNFSPEWISELSPPFYPVQYTQSGNASFVTMKVIDSEKKHLNVQSEERTAVLVELVSTASMRSPPIQSDDISQTKVLHTLSYIITINNTTCTK